MIMVFLGFVGVVATQFRSALAIAEWRGRTEQKITGLEREISTHKDVHEKLFAKLDDIQAEIHTLNKSMVGFLDTKE